MNEYFKTFPRIEYPIGGTDNKILSVDLSVRHVISDELKNNPHAYHVYTVKENERPDQIAKRYYGNANLAWLVMLSADVFDAGYDLPMNTHVFEKYLEDKYGKTVNELAREVYYYVDGDGVIIDADSYAKSTVPGKHTVTIYQFELEENEKKANIKLISKKYVERIMIELTKRMNAIKTARRIAKEKQE